LAGSPELSAMKKEYSKADLTVIWEPEKCMHSKKCWKELLPVFNPNRRPWVDLSAADNERIIQQVNKCPSGALSLKSSNPSENTESGRIELMKDGPLLFTGKLQLLRADGSIETINEKCALCRCGSSGNKPFCDGSHVKSGFRD